MIMKNQLLNLKMIALMCLMMVLGGANVWAEEEVISLANGSFANGQITWTGTSCSIIQSKGTSINPPKSDYVSAPRWYKNHVVSFEAKKGYKIDGAIITSLNNNDKPNAKGLANSNYTNATATVNGNLVEIKASGDFKIVLGEQCRIKNITILYTNLNPSSPTLVSSESALDFGAVENNTSKDLTFKLSGKKLTADAALSVDGEYFTVTPTSVAQTDGAIPETDVTVSYKPTAVGSHTATLTISSTGAEAKTITLTGTSANAYNVAWNVNGNVYTDGTPTTKVFDGEKVTVLPATPSDINGKVFVGWTNSEIAAEQNDAPSVLFTSADGAPVVSNNITYYAVFAKEGGKVVETETEDTKFDNTYTSYCGVNNGLKRVGNGIKKNKIWSTLSNEIVKLKVYHISNSKADVLTLALINEKGNVVSSKDIKTTEFGTKGTAAGYSDYVELQANSSVTGYSVTLKTLNSFGTSVGKVTREVVEGTSSYCTTVGAAAEPTYTKQTLKLIAKDDESYYATFSSDKVTFFPIDQAMPYAITVANGKITDKSNMFEPKEASAGRISGYYIPANTGIMLYSTASNVNYYTVENYTVDALAEGANMLMPAPVAGGKFTADAGKVYYKLAYGDWTNKTQLGFYWGADNGGAFYVKAGTAYLAVPKAKAAGAKGFTLNGEATGIEGVNANVENAKAIYNLNGQRVASMAKPGLYIVNGKKVVRK